MYHHEVRTCDRCGTAFHPVREAQRFCSTHCHDHFYVEERRKALAVWREMQRHQQMIEVEDSEAKVA